MRALLAVLLILAAPPAWGQSVFDPASGLSITPPDHLIATPTPPGHADERSRGLFDIKRPGETDTGCRVAVTEAPGNALLSQEALNFRATSPQVQRAVAEQLSRVYVLVGVNTVLHSGIIGIGAIGDFRPAPNLPARASQLRTLMVFLDTPTQRVTLSCVDERESFDARLQEFDAVLRGIKFP